MSGINGGGGTAAEWGNYTPIRQPAVSRTVTIVPWWLQTLVVLQLLVILALIVGVALVYILGGLEIKSLRKRGTDIGDVNVGDCEANQILRFDGEKFFCSDDVMRLDDLSDVDVLTPKPDDKQCMCFNETEMLWGPQGPFVKVGDIPDFINGTLPCDSLPDNGGARLCNALRWGDFLGTWDASTNTPTLSSGGCPFGDFYLVNVSGNTNLDGNFEWDVGDAAACSGLGWNRIGKNIPVFSVNGMTGDVMLSLGTLTDVDLTGQVNGDFLQRVGGLWTPQQVLLALNDLTDVIITLPAAGEVLEFDGANWRNEPDCCQAFNFPAPFIEINFNVVFVFPPLNTVFLGQPVGHATRLSNTVCMGIDWSPGFFTPVMYTCIMNVGLGPVFLYSDTFTISYPVVLGSLITVEGVYSGVNSDTRDFQAISGGTEPGVGSQIFFLFELQ